MPAGKTESNVQLSIPSLATSQVEAPRLGARWRWGAQGARASGVTLSFLALSLLALAGCNRKSAEKCEQAQSTVRQALQAEDFESAKQWRTYAYKQCADAASLTAMDREIVDKETQIAEAKQKQEADEARAKQYLSLFAKFVADHRAAPEETSKSPDCGDDPRAEKTKERWCKVTRKVGDAGSFELRYWEADPKVVRFTTKLPKAQGCEDLGGSATVVKGWDVPAGGGTAKRFHCEMTSGALQGMHAVVTGAQGAAAHVFTPEYLAADAALRKYAQAE